MPCHKCDHTPYGIRYCKKCNAEAEKEYQQALAEYIAKHGRMPPTGLELFNGIPRQ